MKVLKLPSQFIMNEGSSSCLAQLDVIVVGFASQRQEGRHHNTKNVGFPTLNSGGITQLMDIMSRTGRVPVSGARSCADSQKSARAAASIEMIQSFCVFAVFFSTLTA